MPRSGSFWKIVRCRWASATPKTLRTPLCFSHRRLRSSLQARAWTSAVLFASRLRKKDSHVILRTSRRRAGRACALPISDRSVRDALTRPRRQGTTSRSDASDPRSMPAHDAARREPAARRCQRHARTLYRCRETARRDGVLDITIRSFGVNVTRRATRADSIVRVPSAVRQAGPPGLRHA